MQVVAGQVTPLATSRVPVARILGHNPGPMTGPGTNSYLIGSTRRCLLDPGPVSDAQMSSLLAAIGSDGLDTILVTHTHRDHSPAASRLAGHTGARLVGLPAPDAPGHDPDFQPAARHRHGEVLDFGDYSIELVHTPGHVSNHLCYLLREERLLFTGDHILQGTTPVILPPDGDMAAYLRSLRELRSLDLAMLAPGHGDVMTRPVEEIDRLLAHRLQREEKVLAGLRSLGACDLDTLVQTVYDDVAPHLIPWAKKTLLAHLYKLEQEGRATSEQELWRVTGD